MIELQPMDIIVTRDKTPLSWWIRVKTGSEWSHACLAGEHQTIYTTAQRGFSHVPAESYLAKKSYAVYRMPNLSSIQKTYGLRLCDQQLDKPYAYRDLISLVLQNYQGHGVKKLNRDSPNYFCSEFVSYVFRQMGLKLSRQLHKEPNAYTPVDCTDDVRLTCIVSVSR